MQCIEVQTLELFTPDGSNKTHNDPGWLCMARDDIPGVRGVPGGPGGHQGAPGATRLLPTQKWVIKQQKKWLQTMIKSTQSVSWPKRDSICSFLRHLGQFGCISTVLFSENPIWSKTRLELIFRLNIYTGQTVQFFGGFAIFHTSWDVQEVWKIAKKHNYIAKFGCVNI